MVTSVSQAWEAYYRPGMSSEEAQAFKAGFTAGYHANATNKAHRRQRSPWTWPLVALVTLLVVVMGGTVLAIWFGPS